MVKFKLIFVIILFCTANYALAGGNQLPPKQLEWEFDGIFGKFDRRSAQRGYQVYSQVCAACHSLKLLAYRNLMELGFSPAEVKAIAGQYEVKDGPNDEGEMYNRPAIPSDRFVAIYPNDNAARAANNGALPPDLSLIIKSRFDGANYVYSLLTGYTEKVPDDFKLQEGLYYNPYFPNYQIAMAPPLNEGIIEYQDGTKASVEQMASDVVNFLQWAAEPEMEARKSMGIKVMIYLAIMTISFYLAQKIIWRNIKK